MALRTVGTGSEAALVAWLDGGGGHHVAGRDVVVVPTAAAFTGATEAAVRVGALCEAAGATVEALMVTDRASAHEPYFARRIGEADVAVLTGGSALHVRAALRDSPVAEALAAAGSLVAIGESATVLGEEMIDPRGGAPTTGLGLRAGAVLTMLASEDQLARTRALIDPSRLLIVLSAEGAVTEDERGTWRAASTGGVVASRGRAEVPLG